MAYKIVYTEKAVKELKKLDKTTAVKIRNYLVEVGQLQDPTTKGKALTANLKGYWRYRVGDYRIICELRNQELVIVVVKIGNRKNIYTKQ